MITTASSGSKITLSSPDDTRVRSAKKLSSGSLRTLVAMSMGTVTLVIDELNVSN